MQLMNTRAAYGWVAIALHWTVAAAVVLMFYLGLSAENAGEAGDRAARAAFMGQHISFGVFVALIVMARIFWSLSQPKPQPPEQARVFQILSRLTHGVLLLGLAILIVSGPLAVWSTGRAIEVFDWFSLPSPFAARNQALHEAAETAHGVGRFAIWIFAGLHLLGVAKHVLIDRDNVLQRMLWVRRQS